MGARKKKIYFKPLTAEDGLRTTGGNFGRPMDYYDLGNMDFGQ